jgi:hypothetical protein
MILNKPQIEEFERLVKPLIQYINDYGNPHCKIIIDSSSGEFLSGFCVINTTEFIKD